MRKTFVPIITAALSFAALTSSNGARAQQDEAGGAEAIVTVHIDGLDEAAWARFATHAGGKAGTTIEYSCLRSGVVVLRMEGLPVHEKADVISVVRQFLEEGGIRSTVEFLHVYVEQRSFNKC